MSRHYRTDIETYLPTHLSMTAVRSPTAKRAEDGGTEGRRDGGTEGRTHAGQTKHGSRSRPGQDRAAPVNFAAGDRVQGERMPSGKRGQNEFHRNQPERPDGGTCKLMNFLFSFAIG